MRHRSYDCNHGCPIEACLEVIGGKWKAVILHHLFQGSKRFGQLSRLMPVVSQRMLTTQLRELEEDGVISRTVHAEVPPRVDSALTPFGRTLEPIMLPMHAWGTAYLKRLQLAAGANGTPAPVVVPERVSPPSAKPVRTAAPARNTATAHRNPQRIKRSA